MSCNGYLFKHTLGYALLDFEKLRININAYRVVCINN
jgi:hypothetical protein